MQMTKTLEEVLRGTLYFTEAVQLAGVPGVSLLLRYPVQKQNILPQLIV